MTTVQQARRASSSPVPVTNPNPQAENWYDVVDAEDGADLIGAHWTQAWSAWRLALAEYAAGLITHPAVDKAAERLDIVITNLAKQARAARAEAQRLFDAPRPDRRDYLVGDALPNPFGKRPGYRSAAKVAQFIGVRPTPDALPLVSIGPSGIGGDFQTELDAALAPVGVTCPECDRSIPEGTACVHCAMHKGVEDHEFEGDGAFTVDEVRTLAGVCYRVLDRDGQIVPDSQTGSADAARRRAAELNAEGGAA